MSKLNFSNKNVLIFFSLCFLLGIIGLLVFGLQLSGYIFAHISAIGLLGFFGIGSAYLANKKGYNEKMAFNFGFSLAISAGLLESIVVFLFIDKKQFICGGVASLTVAFMVLVTYLLLKPKPEFQKLIPRN